MILAPTDFQAFSQATGTPYPDSPDQKAALYPVVTEWKARQQAEAAENRGPNALGIGLTLLGAAGLGAGGLAIYNHLRRQGLSSEAAAQKAREAEAAGAIPARVPDSASVRTLDAPNAVALRADGRPTAVLQDSSKGGSTRGGARARASGQYRARSTTGFHDPALSTLDTPEKRDAFLAETARVHGADSTTFKRTLEAVRAMETTTPSGDGTADPRSLIAGLDAKARTGTTTAAEEAARGGVISTSRTKNNVSAQDGYTAREVAPQFKALTYDSSGDLRSLLQASAAVSPGDRGATLGNSIPGLNANDAYSADRRYATGIDPAKASVFYTDVDGTLKPYIGSDPIYGRPGPKGERGPRIYSGRRSDGSPIVLSELQYLPVDDADFYRRTGLSHPALSLDQIEANDLERPDRRTIEKEDQGVKGLLEDLPASDKRFHAGASRSEGVGDNLVFGRVDAVDQDSPALIASHRLRRALEHHKAATGQGVATSVAIDLAQKFAAEHGVDTDSVLRGAALPIQQVAAERADPVPLDLSGFQHETAQGSPALIAGGRLRRALDDHQGRTGQKVPEPVVIDWAQSLAKEHGADIQSVLIGAGFSSTAQAPERQRAFTSFDDSARALGGKGRDALDRVYTSLGMHAGATEWELESNIRSGNIRKAAESLANELPDLANVFGTYLPGLSQDEKLNVVAEGVSAGLQDLNTAIAKYPERAAQFGIGKGEGGFGVDAFLKTYVRDWVTTRALQLDPSGQPTYRVPADAFELIALDARDNGRTPVEELEARVSGSPDGVTAALKIDRLVSSVQSQKAGDPNNNGTRFAQFVFDTPDADLVSTSLVNQTNGDVRLSFSSRLRDDAATGFFDRNPSEGDIDTRLYELGPIQSRNAILKNKLLGTDNKSDAWGDVSARIEADQQWLDQNAESLERQRTDLNRGILNIDGTPRSVGRGLVISSGRRGAFLAADTAGVHASFREETFNDDTGVALDAQQDIEREQRLLNPTDTGEITDADPLLRRAAEAAERDLVTGSPAGEVPALTRAGFSFLPPTEAEQTARQYGSSKLYFKNLGEGSRGAMAAGEAYEPRRRLRALQAERQDAIKSDSRLSSLLASYGIGSHGTPKARPLVWPVITIANRGATGGERSAGSSPLLIAMEEGTWRNAITGQPDHWSTTPMRDLVEDRPTIWVRSDTLKNPQLEAIGAALTPESGPGIDPHGTYGQFGLRSVARPPADPYAGLEISERSAVPQVGSSAVAASLQGDLDARSNHGEGFRDDSNRRDAIAVATGYIDAVRKANRQMHDDAIAGNAPAAPRVEPGLQIYDEGELTGVGRRGSTFAQEPIAAAPVSSLPPEALQQLNTLRQERSAAVPAGFTDEERLTAEAGIAGDYWDNVVSRGGIRPKKDGSLNLNGMRPFQSPSDAAIAGRIKFLRSKGLI